jgi:hypothetical protein
MQIRHAAALALAGWYLMIPLPDHPEASIKYWAQYGAYETVKQCGEAQTKLYEKSEGSDLRAPAGGRYSTEELKAAFRGSVCISSDDPRLGSESK